METILTTILGVGLLVVAIYAGMRWSTLRRRRKNQLPSTEPKLFLHVGEPPMDSGVHVRRGGGPNGVLIGLITPSTQQPGHFEALWCPDGLSSSLVLALDPSSDRLRSQAARSQDLSSIEEAIEAVSTWDAAYRESHQQVASAPETKQRNQ